ncbi:MAG: hypothetical protein A3G33_07090 [Omnitrophica bacterium RIFCSPLOWO2_12_FULL_44_17]|uniref:N-(5'-phosphoribosyl)anthranilate isomerase n=1 Tax=Candidatus Danuiimicrobium aquiferis TaxID=1801832 RepID=A0A1G1KYJ2_9BACT|nr:MAG: hypothetical protein A3B72_07385 [Omnitrophica bacterium RIFCSPHIGHO2_02_FULL_45_28]OGW91635.1 MAG: hypothetical protein A3E74_08125 [Omnitrophica bacterium RIFCSPHIGHO2_12_FULL_44_12]OGW97995.1 MAG: hypothetical protein A3G33_07090 [Omnitrophica bacterium RIFCSPLOWO2_12_FULL_44_17]OGX03561.1 MAG: hypothetical protein A3J12_03140 [Omnitrophica bacterium RIFCSPLOWO2_02_FULL_44_11]
MPKIKICGNTNFDDVKLAIDLGADYLGFVFAESKRKIDPVVAKSIIGKFPHFKTFVGVFANQSKDEVASIANLLGLKWLQFHGDETSRHCDYFTDKGFNVIKTFRIKDRMSLKRLEEYNVEAFLFDTYSKNELGGTGKTFDWKIIEDKPYVREKLFLAGGLTVDNIDAALSTIKPYAVDTASGIEKSIGQKNHDLLRKMIEKVKAVQYSYK